MIVIAIETITPTARQSVSISAEVTYSVRPTHTHKGTHKGVLPLWAYL